MLVFLHEGNSRHQKLHAQQPGSRHSVRKNRSKRASWLGDFACLRRRASRTVIEYSAPQEGLHPERTFVRDDVIGRTQRPTLRRNHHLSCSREAAGLFIRHVISPIHGLSLYPRTSSFERAPTRGYNGTIRTGDDVPFRASRIFLTYFFTFKWHDASQQALISARIRRKS